jgi:2-succinyl-5-enolpyruvyl-6-hydroxy-3-cyclohexene-1-carboxylate synthase
MSLQPENVAYLYVGAFVDELARAGLRHVCLCPGSRSAPLALRLADHPALKLWMHLDERSCAFFALGLAKAQRFPVALLCSSGTAAANFMPAIVEAHQARVPLIVLTADRPPELRDTGAPQTIDQIKLYGAYAKWFVEMALPEATVEMLRYARTIAARAVAEALDAPAGVVHLNFPFREPLVPLAPPAIPAELQSISAGRANPQPYARVTTMPRQPEAAPALIATLSAELSSFSKGLIVAGPQTNPDFPRAVTQLSAALGYPILADPLSQVRCGPQDGANGDSANVVDAYDAFLRDANTVERLAPDVILRFGAMPTSKPLMLYLQRYASARQILIDDGGNWNDAARLASDMIRADPTLFCSALATGARGPSGSDWLESWRTTQRLTRRAITDQISAFEELFEGRVFSELAQCLPDGATCYVSSSMPVRDLDTFFPANNRAVRFLANRGANGIDGVVSSALGASLASTGPLVLVIGDIALYHDLNGLLAAKRHSLSATIILINNDGGGIFSFLPQAAYPKHFEQLFGTPHGLDFRPAAELYGAHYQQVNNWSEFRKALTDGLHAPGLKLIEVRTQREGNVTQHRQVWQAVAAALNP